MKRILVLLCLLPLCFSCGSLFIPTEEQQVFKILNKVQYPSQEFLNKQASTSLIHNLTPKEISKLTTWNSTASFLENFRNTECVGCSDNIGKFKPMYNVRKGKFIHFGLQSEMGVENWVFKKNGAFVTRFHSFQGESKERIQKSLKDIQNINYVLEGVYPIHIDEQNVYLEHIQFENPQAYNNEWYQPVFHTTIGYMVDLKEKSPELRFKFDGGLYSYQRPSKKGEPQIINFVEPMFYGNAVDIDEPQTYSSVTDAFYANATFFLLNLEEETKVSIKIESNIEGKDFIFSIFENQGFYTLEEYLSKKGELFGSYKALLDKGSHLIRVLHENVDYAEKPLYNVYIEKSNVY